MVNRKTIYKKSWCDEGILFVRDLLDLDGCYLSFNQFREKFPNIHTHFLEYFGVIEAIKKYQRKLELELTADYYVQETKIWIEINKGNKNIVNLIAGSVATPAGVRKWNQHFEGINLNWKLIFKKHLKTTCDTQLRWFQTRTIHRLLPTKKYLFLRKIVDSPKCTFCGIEDESLCHLFWECIHISSFWKEFERLLKEKCGHYCNSVFSDILVLFGMKENVKTDKPFDLLLIWAKYYIYICQRQGVIPDVNGFIAFSKKRYCVERYASSGNIEQKAKFEHEWLLYKDLFV